MATPVRSERRTRFADFELDLETGELRKSGARLPLPEQPLRLLEVLVEHPGVVVSRDQLRERLWAADTFVDFEHGLNAAVKRLRDALGDSADQPRFIETVPKRGYKFIANVTGPQTAPAEQPTEAAVPSVRSSRHKGLWVGVVAVAAMSAAAAGWWATMRRNEPPSAAPSKLRRLTFDPGLQTDPALSPDGRFVAYTSNKSGNFDIWMQPLEGGPAVQLTTAAAQDTQPDWSPDGSTIVFRSERDGGGIFRVSVTDRHVSRLRPDGFFPRLSPDGARLLFRSTRIGIARYFVANADGSQPRGIDLPPPQERHSAISDGWHPSGRLVFLSGDRTIVRLSVASPSGAPTPCEIADEVRARFKELGLTVAGQPLAWSPDGRTLYFSGAANFTTDIWSVAVDPVSLRMTAGPTRVTTGPEMELMPAARARSGLAFANSSRALRIELLELDVTGRAVVEHRVVWTPGDLDPLEPAMSPDGRTLAFVLDNRGGHTRELQEMDLGTRALRTLRVADLNRGESLYGPRWSRDGTRIAYSFREYLPPPRNSSIRVLDRRSGEESLLTSHVTGLVVVDNPWDWSADGRSILGGGARYVPGAFAIVRLPLAAAPAAERAARVLVSSTELALWQAHESPDGRWVSYNAVPTSDNRSSAIYVVPAAGGRPTLVTDTTGWHDKPRWSSDGRLLYFLSLRDGLLNVWGIPFDTAKGKATGAAFQVTHYLGPDDVMGGMDEIGSVELSVVGRSMAVSITRLSGAIWILE